MTETKSPLSQIDRKPLERNTWKAEMKPMESSVSDLGSSFEDEFMQKPYNLED